VTNRLVSHLCLVGRQKSCMAIVTRRYRLDCHLSNTRHANSMRSTPIPQERISHAALPLKMRRMPLPRSQEQPLEIHVLPA
jgi:hypothetical protein